MALSIYNFFRMSQEVKVRSEWWVNLIPYIAFALPGALTPARPSGPLRLSGSTSVGLRPAQRLRRTHFLTCGQAEPKAVVPKAWHAPAAVGTAAALSPGEPAASP